MALSSVIIHVDMDAFYASVEVLDRPELAGRPVVVGGRSRRAVVSSASYEARRFGVRSAMPVGAALRLCPAAVVLPVRMERYVEVSRAVMGIFRRFTPLVEPLSLDEAFLDVSASRRLFGDGAEIAARIRAAIRGELGLAASAGVAPVKLVAKMASDLAKPDGLLVVPPEEVLDFLAPLPVGRMWGVGPEAEKRLLSLGARSIGDARLLSGDLLASRLGKLGSMVFDFCRGIDPRPVEPPEAAKSVGREVTYDTDITDPEEARLRILALCGRTARRLRRKFVAGRTVTLKVRYSDFVSVTRSATLPEPTDDASVIFAACLALLSRTKVGEAPVRLLGVSVSGLLPDDAPRQASLFDPDAPGRRRNLNKALDSIADRFGEDAVLPGSITRKK